MVSAAGSAAIISTVCKVNVVYFQNRVSKLEVVLSSGASLIDGVLHDKAEVLYKYGFQHLGYVLNGYNFSTFAFLCID